MEMLKILTREKQSAEIPNLQAKATPLRDAGEDILYLQGFAIPRETRAAYAYHDKPFPLTMDLLRP